MEARNFANVKNLIALWAGGEISDSIDCGVVQGHTLTNNVS